MGSIWSRLRIRNGVNIVSIFERHNYTNPYQDLISGGEIIEYDIQSAGYNMIREYKLLSDRLIAKIGSLEKHQRHIYIGKLSRKPKYKTLQHDINDCIKEIRVKFAKRNGIEDFQVINIRKDALFLTMRPQFLEFGKYIKFVPKNTYSTYARFNRKEFYFDSFSNRLDIKGLSDDERRIHESGILEYFKSLFKVLELGSINSITRNIFNFRKQYLNYECPIEYYRELNRDCCYKLKPKYTLDLMPLGFENAPKDLDIHDLDISYNYKMYIIPLISLIINNY